MNSTTCIIESNWVAWTLLAIATVSLAAIAICFVILTCCRRQENGQTHNITPKGNIQHDNSHISYKAFIAINIVLILFLIGIACALCFGGIDLKTSGSASILISALGVMITFVVAWQIWATIASREEIQDARKAAKKANKIANEVKLLNNEFKKSLNLFAAYQSSSDGLSFLLTNRHYKAFHLFATAIIDSLEFINDKGRCAMGAFVNLDNCMNFSENDESMEEYKENWDSVTARLSEIEDALRNADQENKIFQLMAKQHIDKFKKAAREKGFKI